MKKNLLEKEIGFVGTGMMGEPMAENLLKAGHKLMVYDIQPNATKNLVALGAKLARNISEMGSCEIVFIMVNTGKQVEDTLLGEQGIIHAFRGKGLLTLVVMSTISPILIKKLANKVGSKSIAFIDAPVTGGAARAKQGLLTFMVGGKEDIVTHVKPYLQTMGKNIIYTGPLGSGLAMKLVNNLIGTANLYLFPEAMRIGLKAGLDIKTMVETFRTGPANTYHSDQWSSYLNMLEMVLENPILHEVQRRNIAKDIQLVSELAEDLEYESQLLKAICSMVKSAAESTALVTQELFTQMINAEIQTKKQ